MFSWSLIGRMVAGWYGTCRLWGQDLDLLVTAIR